MNALSEVGARELTWRYPRTHNGAFELLVGETKLGWLHVDERLGSQSLAELDGQTWKFRHSAGALPRVIVCKENSPDILAEYVPRLTGGGVLSFASGVSYCWNRSKIWSPTWCFRREGAPKGSVCLSQEAGPLRDGGKVRICGDAAALPEAPVLVLLAWYLRVLAFEELMEQIPGVG